MSKVLPKPDTSHILGNAPEISKEFLAIPSNFPKQYGNWFDEHRFAHDILERLVTSEAWILNNAEEPQKKEARVIFRHLVSEDMLNAGDNIHGGCLALFADFCTALAIVALQLATTGKLVGPISSSLSVVYHSPAPLGAKLRLIATTVSASQRTWSARIEVIFRYFHNILYLMLSMDLERDTSSTSRVWGASHDGIIGQTIV